MKKSIFLVFFAGTFLSAYSQNNNIKEKLQQYYFCLLGGITGSTISGQSDSYEGILPGYQAGAMFVYDIGVPGHYLLSGETNVTSCGSKYKDEYVSGKVVHTYINLPMMVRYKTNGGLYGEVGLQPGFLIDAKDKYNGQSNNDKDYVNGFDVGVPIGLGYIFANKVGINFRYCHGLSNVNKDDSAKDHNRVFSLRLFWVVGH